MTDIETSRAEVEKLSARATAAKVNVHDLSEELPVDWTRIPEVARAAHEAYAALEAARARLEKIGG